MLYGKRANETLNWQLDVILQLWPGVLREICACVLNYSITTLIVDKVYSMENECMM